MHESDVLLYTNINSLYESYVMCIATALMANKATSVERAINPDKLPKDYRDNIDDVIMKGYVISFNGCVYLTTRGCIVANMGMRELVDNDMWPPDRMERMD